MFGRFIFVALISVASAAYLDRETVCHIVSEQPITRNVSHGMIVAAGRLQYSQATREFYMSTNTTPQTVQQNNAQIEDQTMFLDAADDFHETPDLFTITAISARGVEKTMCIDKPSVQGQIPFGIERRTATERNEFNTNYRFVFTLHNCDQDARTARVICSYIICTRDSKPKTCLKAYENGTCIFETRIEGDEDPRFGWFVNTFGVKNDDSDATEDNDLEKENMEDGQINETPAANGTDASNQTTDAGGDGEGTTPATNGTTAMNGTSNTGSGAEGSWD
ncbi:hypothetical protein C8R46DRAFT_1035042 [Mycena filopes]|nr:hypothetical protein C8R46DRAFT_1035042 [Mycena filopes]